MADLGKSDTVVSNVQLDADSLEFDVNTNLPLTNTKASPGSAAPSLQELIEAELSARLCQPDSLEPPSSPTLHSLLSYDSIEPIPPALHTAPTSAPAFSLDSLADLDPFKDPGGPADDESGIDLLSPTKLAAFSNPDSLESTPDLLGSPTRCSQLRGEFHLLTDPPVQHTMYETGPVAQAPLLIMDERKVSITTAESQINTETNISQQIFDYVSSDSEATLQHHVTHISNMSVQSDVQISNSESDMQNVESISVSRSGEISQTFEELCTTTEQNVESISGSRSGEISQTFDKLCTTTEPIMSELPQEHSAPQPVHEVITEGGGWNTEGQATVGVTVTSDVTLTSSFPPTDLLSSSPPPNSSPQPPHTGALTPSSTNSVYGDSSHAGDDDRVGGGWSGDDGGGVEDPCHPPVCGDDPCLPPTGDGGALVDPTPSLGTHTNMEEERSDEDDFWSSMKKDDDDEVTHVSSRLVKEEEEQTEYTMKISKSSEYEVIKYSDNNEDEEENETKAYEEDEANMEEEEEEEDDEEEKGLRKKTKVVRPAENGVAAAKTPVEPKAPVEVKKKPPTENGVAKASEPPVAEKKKTVVEEKKPVREEKKPVREEKKPVREEKKPVIEEKKSVREEKKPVIEEKEGKKMAREENGIEGTEESMEKKKKKKSRLSEDGEKKSKKKKKKRGDSEKENKTSSSSGSSESEEEPIVPPTPPLFNGRALTNGLTHPSKDPQPHKHIQETEGWITEEKRVVENRRLVEETQVVFEEQRVDDKAPLVDEEIGQEGFGREDFDSLLETYNNKQEEARPQSSLSDQDDLAGVNVKRLTVSYLTVAQKKAADQANNHKSDVKPEIKADLNASVNISSLVDSYSTHTRASTPSARPDDLTPVSFRSLKSAYEATAAGGGSGTVSRHSSSGSSSPAGGSPAPKEELNISLHQLREEYCRSVEDGYSRNHTPSRPPPDTGVSIRHLQVSQLPTECRQCGKQVFQMERIVAEKASWHKNCFRCKECNCILTLETYQSHEGVLYCKPHFKDLFRPKAVIEDEDAARRERSTAKPDYGLEELNTASLKQKFAMFEQISTEEEKRLDPIPVKRSQSLLGKAARFMQSEDDDYGIENAELGEYEEYDEEEDEEEEEEDEEGEEGEKLKKKGRPTSFSGLQDLKAGFARKNRREEMTKKRREELSKFRQMLCAGKNISTREVFESGNLEDEEGKVKRKEQIKIDGCPAARNLRERFEKGLSVEEDETSADRREVDAVFRKADTASKARNLFKEIDTAVVEGNEPVMRPRSSAQARRDNRLSRDGVDVEERELGRDPNLIRCTDNYEDAVDCRGTRDLLAKFRKLEMKNEDGEAGPRPLKRFTPPPGGEEEYDSDEEYSDEEYSDDEEDSEEEDEEEDDEEGEGKPKYKDEILEMVNSSQSARKAASLRAKFEKWESEVERKNEYNEKSGGDDEEEGMPSIDTARNLRAMFENKAQESARPVTERPKPKVNRFVGGGGDKCMLCERTVYAMERLEVAARVLHKNCFKCCKCNTKLSMNTFSIGGNDMYCTTHYKQAFTEKGTYDVFNSDKECHKQLKITVC